METVTRTLEKRIATPAGSIVNARRCIDAQGYFDAQGADQPRPLTGTVLNYSPPPW